MTYNNNFGANYTPYQTAYNYTGLNYQTQMPMQQNQPQPQPSGSIMTVFVNTEDEVPGYPVAAGTTVLLLCFPAEKFWLKSTSTNGVPEALREFPFKEKTIAPAQTNMNAVTRDEFNELSSKIDKLIQDLGGAQNG